MILIIDCGSQKTPFIEQLVDEFMDYKTVKIQDLTSENLNNKFGVIISGAPILITEVDTYSYDRLTGASVTLKPAVNCIAVLPEVKGLPLFAVKV
jgi:GMP synthase-like glutamine amidotransferase